MRIFYSPDYKHLIAIPARNGSSHIQENLHKYGLIETTYLPAFRGIISEVTKKTFIYRDPCIRLLSFYNQFIYEPYLAKTTKYGDSKLFIPSTRGYDLLSDVLNAKDNIIKNYEIDAHTSPQSNYFMDLDYKQDIEDYEIIPTSQYVKWLYLTFADRVNHEPSKIEEININVTNFNNMQKIQELCMTLYRNDYELLEPNITYV